MIQILSLIKMRIWKDENLEDVQEEENKMEDEKEETFG